MFCHVVAEAPSPPYPPLDCNAEAGLPTGGVSYGCRENDHKPSCFTQHRLISFGFWGSDVSSGSWGFTPSGGPREQSVYSPGPASWPGGRPSFQHLLEWTHLFSNSDPPASRFHLEHVWGDVGPTVTSPHLRLLHHIHKIPFALEGDTFTGSRPGTATSFTGHSSLCLPQLLSGTKLGHVKRTWSL